MLRKRGLIFPLLAAASGVLLLACGPGKAEGAGLLKGSVSRSEACPTEPCGRSPAGHVTLVVTDAKGRQVKEIETDADGAYSVKLQAGTYKIELAASGALASDTATTVTVTNGKETRLDAVIAQDVIWSQGAGQTTLANPTPTTVPLGTPVLAGTVQAVSTAMPSGIGTPLPTRGTAATPVATPGTQATRQPPAGLGTISGRISAGPACPVAGAPICGPGESGVAGITVKVLSGSGRAPVASVFSAADGSFTIDLPPGTYTINIDPRPTPPSFTKDVPMQVVVAAGRVTTVNIVIDSGVR